MVRKNVRRFTWEYNEIPEIHFGVLEPGDNSGRDFSTEYNSYRYEGVVGESRRVLGRIREAVDRRREKAGSQFPLTLVLGVEDYLAVDAWLRYDSGGDVSIDDAVSLDIVTVPGRMIHVPPSNDRAVVDHLKSLPEQ